MARNPKVVAVVTGDVVKSTAVKDRALLNKVVKQALAATEASGLGIVRSFEVFRGDSFQGVVEPKDALKVALIIRARLRQWEGGRPISRTLAMRSVRARLPILMNDLPDARIAIGIGSVSYRAGKVVESDGEAYRNSGRALDDLGRTWGRLSLSTPWDQVNAEFGTSMQLLDALVGKWSSASAQAMFLYLTKGATQSELSNLLGISQPAVHKRLVAADQSAVQAMIGRYDEVVSANLKR